MTIQIQEYENSKCLACDAVDKLMVKIGPMIFCVPCAKRQFKYSAYGENKLKDLKTYNKWLDKYKALE